jgi:hypothetical protein
MCFEKNRFQGPVITPARFSCSSSQASSRSTLSIVATRKPHEES